MKRPSGYDETYAWLDDQPCTSADFVHVPIEAMDGLLRRVGHITPSDNKCKCAAFCESECACGADWTPSEVIELRAQLAAAIKEREYNGAVALAYKSERDEWAYKHGPSLCMSGFSGGY